MLKLVMPVILISVIMVFGSEKTTQKQKIPQYPANTAGCDGESICFKPIGYFKTPYSKTTRAPRQGILKPDIKATTNASSLKRAAISSRTIFSNALAETRKGRSVDFE